MTVFTRPWRALIASISGLFGGESGGHWVEPSNAITRAILSGHVSALATLNPVTTSVVPTMVAVEASAAFVPNAPAPLEHAPLVAESAAVELEYVERGAARAAEVREVEVEVAREAPETEQAERAA